MYKFFNKKEKVDLDQQIKRKMTTHDTEVTLNIEKIGKFIKYCRTKNGLTQEQLGAEIGLSGKAISKWECGVSLPDITVFPILSQLLGVSLAELYCGKKLPAEIVSISEKVARHNLRKANRRTILFLSFISLVLCFAFIISMTFYANNFGTCKLYSFSSSNDKYVVTGMITTYNNENMLTLSEVTSIENVNIHSLKYSLHHNGFVIYQSGIDYESFSKTVNSTDLLTELSKLRIVLNSERYGTYKVDDSFIEGDFTLTITYIDEDSEMHTDVIDLIKDEKFTNTKLFYR